MDQELADAAAYAPGRRCVYTLQMAALSAWNDIMGAMLKEWRQIRNPTRSLDAIYLNNIPAEFHPYPSWNDGAVEFFEGHPRNKKNNKKKNDNKMSSDMRSVRDPKSRIYVQLVQIFVDQRDRLSSGVITHALPTWTWQQ